MTFPDDIIQAAQAAARKYPDGPPVAVSLAQWELESGGGVHEPVGSNNPFGIKGRPNEPFVEAWTHEYIPSGSSTIRGRYIRVQAKFRKFDSVAQAFEAHAELLTHPRYAKAQEADTDEDYALALSGIYATDPDYGAKLIRIMDEGQLYQYDVD